MLEPSRKDQTRVDELLPITGSTDQVQMVLADAERGLDEPRSLTLLEVQRVCFALVATYADRGSVLHKPAARRRA